MKQYHYNTDCGTSAPLREYIWLDGAPVAVVENGVVYYVRTDHIGRPVFATDGSGANVWEATYLPFGGMLATWGSFTTPGAPPPPPGRPPPSNSASPANGSKPRAACTKTGWGDAW